MFKTLFKARALACACAALGASAGLAARADTLLALHTLDRVTVTGGRPSSLPIEIPTTTEGVDAERIERSINATDAEDALKYLPSLLVRKRYIGDHDHAVLATRASGTGNSARSLVYADGILLSNLLGNGAAFTPRWGLVTPDEIERVDVLYGPFSAAYPGNSAGAIVDYVTRMPTALQAQAKVQAFRQRFRLYRTDADFDGRQASASIGSRAGAWSWFVNVDRLDGDAQPLNYPNRLVSAGTPSSAGTPVSGAVAGADPRARPWQLLGTTGATHTVQDHAKLKLALDLSESLRASYTLGWWRNDAERGAESWLRDAGGNAVASGTVNIDGRSFALLPTDFSRSRHDLQHLAQGLSLEQHTGGRWDWKVAASKYSYRRDQVRAEAIRDGVTQALVAPALTELAGTGWTTLAAKGIWRPAGKQGAHIVEFGAQRDAFKLRQAVSCTAAYESGAPVAAVLSATGDTALTSLWLQDAWRFAPRWRSVLGLRAEHWRADHGSISGLALPPRSERHFSPKAALAFTASDDWTLKASLGRAVRMPTVGELYQGGFANGAVVNNDPTLRPEKSWTGELSAERALEHGLLRATLFGERTRDALYAQTNVTVVPNVTNVQNVDAIRTRGIELAGEASHVGLPGLDLQASLTYADSKIVRNDKFPASVGQRQPRVPLWRASVLASYAFDANWSASLGARYSGRQFGQLDNSDVNEDAYTGFSRFFVMDARVLWKIDRHWSAAFGIDNLGNSRYWAFHPYPQRTLHAELKWAL